MNVFEQTATIRSWDEDYYHPAAEKFYDRAIADMLSMFGAPEGAVILDAGCGPGVHSIRAARDGYRVFSIDISSAMLREAKERVAKAGYHGRASFQQEDLTKLSFADGSVKYAFSWGVIIHIPKIEEALDEFTRVMAPKAKLAFYVSNESALDQKIERLARKILRKPLEQRQRSQIGTGIWYDMHGERLWLWLFDIPELIRQMERRGFSLIQRRAGEFSEIQKRAPRGLRTALLYFNRLYYLIGLPATWAAANLLVFEKKRSAGVRKEPLNGNFRTATAIVRAS